MKPEEILPDDQNRVALKNGGTIRKGTVAAFIANIDIIESQEEGSAAYQEAVNDLKTLIPACEEGLLRHFEVKSPRVRAIIDNERRREQS